MFLKTLTLPLAQQFVTWAQEWASRVSKSPEAESNMLGVLCIFLEERVPLESLTSKSAHEHNVNIPLSSPPSYLMAHIYYYFTDLELLADSRKPTAALKQETYDFLQLKCSDPHKALFESPSSTTPLHRVSLTQFTLTCQSRLSSTMDRWHSSLTGYGHQESLFELTWANVLTWGFL